MYKETDVIILRQNADRIKDLAEKLRMATSEPSFDDRMKAHCIVKNYCRENKRKLYGGFALHLLLTGKNVQGIYREGAVPDIDVYSFDPLNDMYLLCNLLHRAGLSHIMGQEAQHKETYTIKFFGDTVCDLSYVPKNVYARMAFMEVDGLQCIHPNFMMIDYLRMLSNPLDYWRCLDCSDGMKVFNRLNLLQRNFPLPINGRDLNVRKAADEAGGVMGAIREFLVDRESVVVIGFMAYNHFCKVCRYNEVDVPFYEFISVDFRKDVLELIDRLKEFGVTYTEFCPFFQYTDHSVEIYMKGVLVCRIFGNNRRCIQYREVGGVRMGSYTVVVLHLLIGAQRARVVRDDFWERTYYHMLSHCILVRNEYLVNMRVTFLDDGPFQEFVCSCAGKGVSGDQEMRMRIERRKKKGQRLVNRYIPADELKENAPKYVFGNSSGNKITNARRSVLASEKGEDGSSGSDEEVASVVTEVA